MNVQNIVISVDDARALAAMFNGTLHQATELLGEAFDGAEIVASEKLPKTVAALNAVVDYVELAKGAARSVMLVGPAEADPAAGRVSVLSPVGRALLGRTVGATSEIELPSGLALKLKIKSVKQGAPAGEPLKEGA